MLAFSLVSLFLFSRYFSAACIFIGGFFISCCLTRNKWYQSISGSSWDRVSISGALMVVWRRSCVVLGATLELIVGSCVDLRTTFGLLEESNLVELIISETLLGFHFEVKILFLSSFLI